MSVYLSNVPDDKAVPSTSGRLPSYQNENKVKNHPDRKNTKKKNSNGYKGYLDNDNSRDRIKNGRQVTCVDAIPSFQKG